jgi:hypothetical protein
VSPITNKKPCTEEELHLRYQALKYCYLNISTNYFQKYFSGTSTIADEYENGELNSKWFYFHAKPMKLKISLVKNRI